MPWNKLKTLMHSNILFLYYLSFSQALQYILAGISLDWNGERKCVFLNFANKYIIFCWVPSHSAIRGKETADSALDLFRAKVGVPYTYFILFSQPMYSFHWQDDWNDAVSNKLHSVKP